MVSRAARGKAATGSPTVLVASAVARIRRKWLAALRGDFSVHEVTRRGALEWSVASLRPDVLLLDFAGAGPADLRRLLQLSPGTKIVLCSRAPDDPDTIPALQAGARGCLQRGSDPLLIRKAVDRVSEGEIWVGRSIVPRLLQRISALAAPQRESARDLLEGVLGRLSRRERDTAELIMSGASNREIAGKLGIREATVKAHLTAIFRKLQLHDRLHLALFLSRFERNRAPKPQ
jgi:DNA-binding NarL/FixJ family response regulator